MRFRSTKAKKPLVENEAVINIGFLFTRKKILLVIREKNHETAKNFKQRQKSERQK